MAVPRPRTPDPDPDLQARALKSFAERRRESCGGSLVPRGDPEKKSVEGLPAAYAFRNTTHNCGPKIYWLGREAFAKVTSVDGGRRGKGGEATTSG